MSKSVLYATNSSTQTVTSGSTISFGNIVRRYGCNATVVNGNVVVKGEGYYGINTNFTVTTSTAGTAVITLYKNGEAIPGATTSFTTPADTNTVSVTIPSVIRINCCNESSITATISGVGGSITNASIVVEKE